MTNCPQKMRNHIWFGLSAQCGQKTDDASVSQGHIEKASSEEAIDAFLVHWTHRVQPHPIVDKLTMELNSPFQNIFDMEQLKAKYTFYSIKFYIIAKISLFFNKIIYNNLFVRHSIHIRTYQVIQTWACFNNTFFPIRGCELSLPLPSNPVSHGALPGTSPSLQIPNYCSLVQQTYPHCSIYVNQHS